jgi:hypothetical protein
LHAAAEEALKEAAAAKAAVDEATVKAAEEAATVKAVEEAAEAAKTAAEEKLEAKYDELYRLQNELLAAPRKQRKVMKKQIDLLDTEITQLRDAFKSSYGH